MATAVRADAVVVGAGWAGLAAAIHLAKAGRSVRLIDAAPQAGGRARRITLDWKHPTTHAGSAVELDNGQHLLLGAYRAVLSLLELVGALDDEHLERRPMRLASSSGLLMERPSFGSGRPGERGSLGDPGRGRVHRLLAPLTSRAPLSPRTLLTPLTPLLGLIGARGLSAASKWAMVRTLMQLRLGDWLPPASVSTVSEWYVHTRQPAELIERIWQPLAISALNTPAGGACARTFLAVLKDSLGGKPGADDFILPRRNLSHLFVDPALAWLRRHETALSLRTDIRRIEPGSQMRYRIVASARVEADPLVLECDRLVLATPPYVSARLLEGIAEKTLIGDLKRFQYLPITTAYVGWPALRLPVAGDTEELVLPPLVALRESVADQRFAQWFFDRGRQGPWRVAALVLSDSRDARALGDDRLGAALIRQLADELALPAPAALSLIHEKRATFACTPDRPRLAVDATHLPGLALAGDYTYPDYPATLEGAVRSGSLAAEAVMSQ